MVVGDGLSGGGLGAPERAVRVLAKSLFRELKRAGYNRAEMVAFATELLELVTDEIRTGEGVDGQGSAS